jgi:ParB/RepB/Spo0J family partition protein
MFPYPETATLLDASCIRPGNNDRKDFDREALSTLAASIAEIGIIQVPTVRPLTVDGEETSLYEIVAGERRFRAMVEILGVSTVPVTIADDSDEAEDARRMASWRMAAENLARTDLNPMEEARAYSERMQAFGSTVEEAARACGVSTRRVHARIKLLRLSPEIQQVVTTGDFSIGYAQILAESNLDVNRQRVAMQTLRKEKSPSPGWFRSVCGELAAAQAQESLLDGDDWMQAPDAGKALSNVASTDPDEPDTIAPTAADSASLTTRSALHAHRNASACVLWASTDDNRGERL